MSRPSLTQPSVLELAGEAEVSVWEPLSRLPYLEKLVVDASSAAHDSPCMVLRLEQLAACPRLCSLELRGCELGACSGLRNLQRLCQLRLQDCTQASPGDLMRELRPLTQLEVLQVQVGIPHEYALKVQPPFACLVVAPWLRVYEAEMAAPHRWDE